MICGLKGQVFTPELRALEVSSAASSRLATAAINLLKQRAYRSSLESQKPHRAYRGYCSQRSSRPGKDRSRCRSPPATNTAAMVAFLIAWLALGHLGASSIAPTAKSSEPVPSETGDLQIQPKNSALLNRLKKSFCY